MSANVDNHTSAPFVSFVRYHLPLVSQLSAVVKNLLETLQKTATERAEYQRKHGIQAVPQSMAKTLMASTQAQQQAQGGSDEDDDRPAPGRQGILA